MESFCGSLKNVLMFRKVTDFFQCQQIQRYATKFLFSYKIASLALVIYFEYNKPENPFQINDLVTVSNMYEIIHEKYVISSKYA